MTGSVLTGLLHQARPLHRTPNQLTTILKLTTLRFDLESILHLHEPHISYQRTLNGALQRLEWRQAFFFEKATSTIKSLISITGYALQHCYFNPEWVGEYVLQIPPGVPGVNVQIPQSRLSIGLDSIPILGECYQRRGNNFLLIERLDFHEGWKSRKKSHFQRKRSSYVEISRQKINKRTYWSNMAIFARKFKYLAFENINKS